MAREEAWEFTGEEEETYLYCQQCDFIVDGDYTFCPDCGERLMEYDRATCQKYGIDTDKKGGVNSGI